MSSVSVSITGGSAITVPWTANMTAQDAIEAAWNAINNSQRFTYGLQYFGSSLGYLVFMINNTYDTSLGSSQPYFFWEFLVNGIAQNLGIDFTTLNAGDAVDFSFVQYNNAKHAGTTLAAKAARFKS